jgi:putative phosphoribosyl transferase
VLRVFRDRSEGGEALAERLITMDLPSPRCVIALPRGGLPTAAVIARRLCAPLDVITVRKVGLPWNPECAIGAVAPGVVYRDEAMLPLSGLTPEGFDALATAAEAERQRRERRYREGRPPLNLKGCTAILVDDGLATGATMLAAVRAARAAGAARIIAAVPVASAEALARVTRETDQALAVCVPSAFAAVGQWYERFAQVEDEEALAILRAAPRAATSAA